MSWLSRLEQKYGKYAISNITFYLVVCYAFGYIIEMFNGSFLSYLTLDPYAILHGQVWRLVTWLIIPPDSLDIFTLVMLYFYFSIGGTLERTWGTFRYNVYLISGMVFTVIGAFLFMGVCYLLGMQNMAIGIEMVEMADFFRYTSLCFSTYYICMSIILAFAMTFPDAQVLFMFIIPLKIKILGIVYALILGYDFMQSVLTIFRLGNTSMMLTMYCVARCFAILFSLLSCIIFFVTTRKSFRTPNQMRRQHAYKKKVVHAQRISRHKCAICGRTAEEYPDLEFRFCSKCKGNYEYCSEHLFTHKHVE